MNYISFKLKERQIVRAIVYSSYCSLSPKDVEVLTGISSEDCLMCCYKSKKFYISNNGYGMEDFFVLTKSLTE